MKNMKKILFCLFALSLALGCGNDDVLNDFEIEESEQNIYADSDNATKRSYEEEECGSIDALCMKCLVVAEPNNPILVYDIGGAGNQIGIDDNYLSVEIDGEEYTVRPAKFFSGESEEYVISTPKGNFIASNIDNDYVRSKALDVSVPQIFEQIYNLDFDGFVNGDMGIGEVGGVFGGEILSISSEGKGVRVSLSGNMSASHSDPNSFLLFSPCEGVSMAALVLRYQDVLGMNSPHVNAEQIIEAALSDCTLPGFNPRADCINTQCVMEKILVNPEISGSPYSQFLIKG